ncbi:MucR family transcriptional regulator [Novosphingobium sp.]|uniref:MucR family transcriptional regulator n=1 Tax=Novosphingobium sp. TaxID=1874826 RepID=UPI003529E1DA
MPEDIMLMTGEIVTAFVGHNTIAVNDIPNLIGSVHAALSGIGSPVAKAAEPELVPAVPIRASVKPDHVTCLDCGTKTKMLKRHLMSAHGLTPEQYLARWNLPANHALVAPNYAAKRREMAIKIGLGRKPGKA